MNLPTELVNKIVMMNRPKYDYLEEDEYNYNFKDAIKHYKLWLNTNYGSLDKPELFKNFYFNNMDSHWNRQYGDTPTNYSEIIDEIWDNMINRE